MRWVIVCGACDSMRVSCLSLVIRVQFRFKTRFRVRTRI